MKNLWEGQFIDPSVLYISTSVWMLRTPKAGLNSHFQHFAAKNLKKTLKRQEICSKFQQKTGYFDQRLECAAPKR